MTQTLQNDLPLWRHSGWSARATASTIPPDRAAFWHVLGLKPHLAESRMKETTVSVTKFGTVPIGPFASALAALNIQTGEDSKLAVVLTND